MPNVRPIRRGQLIIPFGVGALVDFRNDESLMTAGLDEWPFANEECPLDWHVSEERLQSRLDVSHFRLPPDYRDPSGPNISYPNQHIPFVRFPRWHYCPLRGAMEKLSLFGDQSKCPCRPGLDCEKLPERRRPKLIPSRFVSICPNGHIEDFPFMEWVHKNGSWDSTHKLRFLPGRSSSSLSGTEIKCSCGKSENLAGIFNFDATDGGALHKIGYDCSGGKPWVGDEGRKGFCGEHLRVVQRGSSNVYFPFTVSSIYLPLWGEDMSRTINQILDDAKSWNLLTTGLEDGKFVQTSRCEIIAQLRGVDADDLRVAAQNKLEGSSNLKRSTIQSEEEFRRQEYEALRMGRGGESTDLMVEVRCADKYGLEIGEFLEKICLVRKLRETRVLVGFSRLLPVEDPESQQLLPISDNNGLNWLPATVVYGEGIFFEFNSQMIRNWSEILEVKERVEKLNRNYNRSRIERGLSGIEFSAKYILLHSFAHSLINQLSVDCGYGSAALRERIYCESTDSDEPMQGVLIYTASGDSEGTLGGLVRQGEPDYMVSVFKRAIYRAQWCSSDPVCIESVGQGTDNANLAACHGCLLLPETSCETGNRLLDRGMLLGAPDNSRTGFFSHLATIDSI